MNNIYDVVILGAGPAGLAAGLYAGRSCLKTLIIEKGQDGGQIAITDEIENYPGCNVEEESGPSLMARFTAQAAKFGCDRVSDTIKEVQLEGKVKKLIGVSPQETAVAPNLSVKENLELICGIYGFSKEKSRTKIAELAAQFHLQDILTKKAGKLSGGWQRRVSIAMALISEPSILFLDEPTLGLDVLARSELWDVIRTLKGKITIILTTHYMEEAEALSDRIGIMKDGKLLVTGTAEALMEMTSTDRFENAFISIIKEAQK
jgi:ABC-type Na+ transport system ATPase subunit NatA